MFATEVDPGRLVRQVAIGPITANSVAAAWHRWLDDAAFDPPLPVLWDCRGQFIHASLPDLLRLDELTTACHEERREADGRTAVLVDYSMTQVIVQEIREAADCAARIEVFTDAHAAYHWLGVDCPAAAPEDRNPTCQG